MNKLTEIKQKGMFYTEDSFSKLLIENISSRKPKNILELGVGDGSLIRHAIKKWNDAKFTCTDINKNEFEITKYTHKINFLIESGLNTDLRDIIKKEINEFDVAICNPPYLKIKISDKSSYRELIDQFDNSLYSKLGIITSDFIFLVQNILMLRDGGVLGIIVPDSILTRKDFISIRESIVKKYNLLCSIELPAKIFSKTEAKTHILVIKKELPKSNFVKLCLADKKGKIVNKILVERCVLIKRMDFNFHNYTLTSSTPDNSKTIKQLNIKVLRGNIEHAALKNIKTPYLHSTSFKNLVPINNNNNSIPKKYTGKVVASKGDIIMVRVGRGCVGKLSIIKNGSYLVSDCIFVFKTPNATVRKKLYSFLTSSYGAKSVKNLVHGTCSSLISKGDMENLLIG